MSKRFANVEIVTGLSFFLDMHQPNYYAVIPAPVRYDRELSASAKLLYGEIAALSDQRGYCWASNGYFAELYGVDKSTIKRWIGELRDGGHITVDVIYAADAVTITARHLALVTPAPLGAKMSLGGGKNEPRGRGKNEPHNITSNEQYKEQERENARTRDDFDYPLSQLFAAFPDLELSPAQCGMIEAAVNITDAEAWRRTIQKYKENFDPDRSQYLPWKVGNVLSVFRAFVKDVAKEKKTNGTTQGKSARSAKPTNREVLEQSADFYANYSEG